MQLDSCVVCLKLSNEELSSGCRRSRRPQAKKCGVWRAGDGWRAGAEIAQIFRWWTVILPLCSLVVLPVIHTRHNGGPVVAYEQIACSQGMQLSRQLVVIQAMTNSSAVTCLFCWTTLSSAPSSGYTSRCLYHSLSIRPGQSHPAIPQAAQETTRSPPYPARPPPHTRRKDPLFTSRVTRGVPLDRNKQWRRHSWKGQPQAQA